MRRTLAAEHSALETTTVRFADFPGSTCTVPQFIAAELLRQDGFSEVVMVDTENNTTSVPMYERDQIDFSFELASALALGMDMGISTKVLAGVHVGCWMLIARDDINSVVDLKGRRVGAGPTAGSDPHVYISTLAAYVGLDPKTDIEWVYSDISAPKLFEEGKVDALLSFPPEAQAVRRQKIGHVIVNSMSDRPWSQYFCCMLMANPTFTQSYPVATKRVLRAVLKAADICIADPQKAVQLLVDRKEIPLEQSDDALTAIKEIPYRAWRDYDPEDTVRFFSLRLHEAGMITTSPQKIIADGTDWSFLNEVKRELKA
jgi:NitT/TauT family transport system substrate-binding protein